MILYVGISLEKYSNYLTGFGLSLSLYDILDLDLRNTQHYDYLTGLGFILLNTELELINQPSRNVVTKVWRLSWINCFLHLNFVLIHAVFTTLYFDDFCMIISPSTLLCFLCSSGQIMHVVVTSVNNTSRMFSHSLVWLIMSKVIVQIHSNLTSLGWILRGVKKQLKKHS